MSPYRYADNPLEKAFAVAWQEANNEERPGLVRATLAYLMDKSNRGMPVPPLTDRDWLVANTVVQWLGSPVGQGFLEHILSKSSAAGFRHNLERCTDESK
jgi:hypothetical protein